MQGLESGTSILLPGTDSTSTRYEWSCRPFSSFVLESTCTSNQSTKHLYWTLRVSDLLSLSTSTNAGLYIVIASYVSSYQRCSHHADMTQRTKSRFIFFYHYQPFIFEHFHNKKCFQKRHKRQLDRVYLFNFLSKFIFQ